MYGESDDDWDDEEDDWGEGDGTEVLGDEAKEDAALCGESQSAAPVTLYRTAKECESAYASWRAEDLFELLRADIEQLVEDVGVDSLMPTTVALDVSSLLFRICDFRVEKVMNVFSDEFGYSSAEMLKSFPVKGSIIEGSVSSVEATAAAFGCVNLTHSRMCLPTKGGLHFSGDSATFECQICVEEFPLNDIRTADAFLSKKADFDSETVTCMALGCGHVFCAECWKDVVRNAWSTRAHLALFCFCPFYKCRVLVPDSMARFIAALPNTGSGKDECSATRSPTPSKSTSSGSKASSPLASGSKAKKAKSKRLKSSKKKRDIFDAKFRQNLIKLFLLRRAEYFKQCATPECTGIYSTLFLKGEHSAIGRTDASGGSSDALTGLLTAAATKRRMASNPLDIRKSALEIARICEMEDDAVDDDSADSSSAKAQKSVSALSGLLEAMSIGGAKSGHSVAGGRKDATVDSSISQQLFFTTGVGVMKPLFASCAECQSQTCLFCDLNEWHEPCNCYLVQKWLRKCRKECENAKWIITNTKKCPECLSRIEKSHGCNHMVCGTCQHEFCWVCMGPWKEHGNHTGGFYKCHKYIAQRRHKMDAKKKAKKATAKHSAAASVSPAKAKTAAAKTTKATKATTSTVPVEGSGADEEKGQSKDEELYKFVHYYNRFHNHCQSKEYLLRNAPRVEAKMRQLLEMAAASGEWIDVDFLKQTHEQIARCRRVLQYTYVFGYYLSTAKPLLKDLFEFLQESLEKNTEYLHELSEAPLDELDAATLRNYASITSAFADKLLLGIQSGLM